MIIQLLGANGAGKSTIVRKLMVGSEPVTVKLWGRRVPDGYFVAPDLKVIGHYQGFACGGGDTLPRKLVTATIVGMSKMNPPWPIILEGPTGREPMLREFSDVRVLYLRRTHDDCLEAWVRRNEEKGLSVNRATMGRRVGAGITRIENMVRAYREEGVTVTTVTDRRYALDEIKRLIGRST